MSDGVTTPNNERAAEPWEPAVDPRRPEEAIEIPWWAAVALAFCLVAALLPVAVAIDGLVHTWHGGTWSP